MSADNQVEPAAAMAASASAAAAAAASGGASDYLKRTCLICGCQTNQTINIYEPRSGPNIVQLIQAKFKFQPLNEDKFLCFSCNNWLINWHSLQALNSNDAESQSRSQSPSHMGNNCSGVVLQRSSRPVAQVRPQPQSQPQPQPHPQSHPQPQLQTQTHLNIEMETQSSPTTQPTTVISYNKRRFGGRSAASTRSMRKMLRYCCVCGAAIVLRLLSTKPTQTLARLARRSRHRSQSQCRKCRATEKCNTQAMQKRNLGRQLEQQQQPQQALVKATALVAPQNQRFPTPRVDGKVVAMFRRLGTTLSTEEPKEFEEPKASKRQLRIMSPAKQRPRWTRPLDDDEILLEFDSALSEVLPPTRARRCLSYQFTNELEAEAEVEVVEEEDVVKDNRKSHEKVTHQAHVKLAGLQLPRGLSITLV